MFNDSLALFALVFLKEAKYFGEQEFQMYVCTFFKTYFWNPLRRKAAKGGGGGVEKESVTHPFPLHRVSISPHPTNKTLVCSSKTYVDVLLPIRLQHFIIWSVRFINF